MRDKVLEDAHAGTHCINNLISMLIILNCAHTQVETVVCQNSRTEWSTAVCDSCVAQLGKTDNPQPAEADNTATFLLRRLKIPSAAPCSHSLPLLHTSQSRVPSKWFLLFQAVSSRPHYIPHPFSVVFISLEWTVAYREHLTRVSRGSRHALRPSIISFYSILNRWKTEGP